MRGILTPTIAGLKAARHLAWYLQYPVSGESRSTEVE
jgi:hypothetical protein